MWKKRRIYLKWQKANKMKDMPVNQLMIRMGIPMILSMALQAVYNIVDSAFVGNMRVGSEAAPNALDTGVPDPDADGGSGESEPAWGTNALLARMLGQGNNKSCKGSRKQPVSGCDYLCGKVCYSDSLE